MSRRLRHDPVARLAAWIWLTVPRRATARLPFLRDVAGDGHFLGAVPLVAVALPSACLAGGFWVGARHWGYETTITESVFLLSVLVALGTFATQLGLLALLGWALGDFFVRFPAWSYTVVHLDGGGATPGGAGNPVRLGTGLLDDGYVAGLWRVRLAALILYLVLGIGVVLVPRIARGIASIALRWARLHRPLDWLVGSFVYVVTVWLALSGWAATVPLLIRPYFTWKGGAIGEMPPAQATVPIQNFGKEIVAAAVVAGIVRQLLVLTADRNRDLAARIDVVVSLAEPARRPAPVTRRGTAGRALGTAAVSTLMIAGMLERWWTWLLAGVVFLLIGVLRSDLLPDAIADAWRRLAERLPLLARLLLILAGVRVAAGFLAGSVIDSYERLAVFVVLAALASVLLLPPPATGPADVWVFDDGDHDDVAGGDTSDDGSAAPDPSRTEVGA